MGNKLLKMLDPQGMITNNVFNIEEVLLKKFVFN